MNNSKNNFLKGCMMICLLTLFTACAQEKIEVQEDLNFNPPKNLQIKRTYAMSADGVKTGQMEAIRKVDITKSSLLIKDVAQSLLSFYEPLDTKSEETFWLGQKGVEEYQGKFTNVKNGETFDNRFMLKGKTLHFESKSSTESKTYKQKFIKGKDYHTATIYIDPTDREMESGKEYKRRMLDVSFARTMKLTEKFLRKDTFTLGEHTFECHVIYIDYGHLHGEVWLAQDELGWFLIYEKATATEGSFELVMDGYEKTKIKVED
ncbi:hypothetical protein [Aquimarina sp. 2201CG5-10]|uniref:hypothetical protein n=1 Tax=Aquimarina callyspongiae TaxID=3098150 RepID=UPI002AB58CFC|nr:hypothetical protein [Aquimarina sp. 2201CG5-10]MDY8136024.1 hypothetical protein [Aquimarina sp. 2201CG5-10]